MKRKVSIWLSITLVFQLFLGTLTVNASEAKSSDISGHWAEQTIQSWLDKGIAKGYQDGSFRPDASITRAEFIKMMNQVFEVPKAQSNVSFEDLTEKHWAYADIAAAVEAGYISGTSETTVSPDANITRQEAAVMLVKLVKLEGTTELNFKDAADIPEWSKKAITALVAGNFLQGDTTGNVRAKDQLKRAEAVVLIDKVSQSLETVFDQEGEYGNPDKLTVINGDVRIAAAGVTLINTEITGNLTVDAAVGEGDVYLKKVVVKGTTLVQGGGENSVHLEDTVVLRIVVDKASGKVRIVAQGATKVQQVVVQSPVKLEESQVTDSGFSNIELTPNLPEGSNIDLVGHFENVHVISANIKITIPSGSVKQLSVGDEAAGNTISLDQSATIETLILDVVTKLIGQGTVNKAQVSTVAQSSSFETAPKQLEVVEKGSPTATPTPTVTPEPSPVIVPTSKPKPTPTVTPTPSASVTPTPTVSPTPSVSTEPTATVNPSPSTSPKPSDQLSNDATIHNLALNDELLLTKMDLANESDLPVDGFDPTHFRYTVDMPGDKQTVEVTLLVDTDENAKLSLYGYDRMGYYEDFEIDKQDNTYKFQLETDKFYVVSLYVRSESDKYSKYYELYFVGALDVQKSFKISQYGDHYSFDSNLVKSGDLVTVTIPAEHSKTGEKVVVVSEKSSYYKDGTYAYAYVSLTDFAPDGNIGELGLKIEHLGKAIYDGEYKFDLTKIDFKEVPDSLLNIEFMSKEEVNEYNNSAYEYQMKAYEYLVKANEKELLKLYPSAAFVDYDMQYKEYYTSNRVYIKDSLKEYHTVYGSNLNNLQSTFGFAKWYDPIDNLDVYEVVTGQILRVMIYDAAGNLIEAFITEFDIPEEYLADQVVPLEIVSEKELEGVPLELTGITSQGIEWKKNLNFSDEVMDDLTFSSDYYHYVSLFDQALDGETLKFELSAAKGLQINAWVQSKDMNNNFNFVTYQDIQKKGLSLKLDSDYAYRIMFTVQNPYTMERTEYLFNLHSMKISDETFMLNSYGLFADNVLPGDLIEVTIPGAYNTKGEDLVYSFDITQDQSYFDSFSNIYLADVYESISMIYDEETERYHILYNNEVGELAIKVIRDDVVVYDGKLSFDFTPVSVIEDVPVYKYTEEERDQYNWDNKFDFSVVLQYDLSMIEGAAYIAQSSGSEPNVQDALNVNRFIKLDAGKYVAGFMYYPEGSTTHTFNDGFYVYDSNHQVLGYASILYEVSEAQSTVNQEAVPVSNEEAGAEQQ